jgi:hypothetical protein
MGLLVVLVFNGELEAPEETEDEMESVSTCPLRTLASSVSLSISGKPKMYILLFTVLNYQL